jgi:phosphohistidine phosphatase SixA
MESVTTIIIIRHGERESQAPDCGLSAEGLSRANDLKRTLRNVGISAIYTTPYRRAKETIKPLAGERNIAITEYSTRKPYDELLHGILAENRGKVVIVVGHSFTIPKMVSNFTDGACNPKVAEDQFDNLFLITLGSDSVGFLNLRYGRETPEIN